VGVERGVATRLTSHPGEKSHAAIAPDGTILAFSASYEGPTEVYTMPLQGGLPTRHTCLPALQLLTLDPTTNKKWNMQYAFRGHLVVSVNAHTASDGEAFAEGCRRLGLGPIIGTRTWGGESWLTSARDIPMPECPARYSGRVPPEADRGGAGGGTGECLGIIREG
jgi:hypothetical protein